MRKLIRNGLTATVVAGTALALTANAASAAQWTVQNGGSKTATNTITLLAEDVSTGAAMTCDTSTASASLPNGTSNGTPLGTVTGVTFTDSSNPGGECNGPGGLLITITPTGLPWNLNGTSYSGGVTTGALTGVSATLDASDGCHATVGGAGGASGQVDGSYDNATGLLGLSDGTANNLEVLTVNASCDPLLINEGDSIRLDGQYLVGGSPKPIITSP
jgi:hypothetical protein